MSVNLVLLEKSTALNVSADKGGEAGPPELSGDQLASFQEAGMTGRFVIVAAFEDGTAKRVVRGDVDTAFVRKDAGVNLPVSQPGTEGEQDVFVHGLKSLEDKGVARRCGFDTVGEGGVDKVHEEGWREEGDIGVVGVIRREEVGSAGEGVGPSKEFARDMDHFEVEIGKVDQPARLSAVKRLGLAEIREVLVVGEDLYREGGPMEIVSPGLQGTNDSKKFAIIDVVIPFGRGKGL